MIKASCTSFIFNDKLDFYIDFIFLYLQNLYDRLLYKKINIIAFINSYKTGPMEMFSMNVKSLITCR